MRSGDVYVLPAAQKDELRRGGHLTLRGADVHPVEMDVLEVFPDRYRTRSSFVVGVVPDAGRRSVWVEMLPA